MPEILVVIPVYNHGLTLRSVVEKVLATHFCLLVVDDGSDEPVSRLLEGLELNILRHPENIGKGAAIRTALKYAHENGFSHILTIDADGQHNPNEIPFFVKTAMDHPRSFIIGARDFVEAGANVPLSSRFGRRFSEFWMFIQTGQRISDMQSGFRVYPVMALRELRLWDSRYSFEIEVLVKAVWSGFEIMEIPINVFYPNKRERVSHFKVISDNWRITVLNTRLTIRALIPLPFRELVFANSCLGDRVTVRRPWTALKWLMNQKDTAGCLAISTFVPIIVCSLPILGLQSLVMLYIIATLKLNRLWALAITHACFPPLMPAFCIEVGHYVNHGLWLTDLSWTTLGREVSLRFFDWLVGALVGGSLLGLSLGLIVFLIACFIRQNLRDAKNG